MYVVVLYCRGYPLCCGVMFSTCKLRKARLYAFNTSHEVQIGVLGTVCILFYVSSWSSGVYVTVVYCNGICRNIALVKCVLFSVLRVS